LWYIHREFLYESRGEKNFENWSTFAKVIIKHQVAYFFLVHGVYTINAVDGSYTLFLQRKLIEIGQGSHLTLPNDLYVFVVMCLFSTGEFQFKLQFQNRINMIS